MFFAFHAINPDERDKSNELSRCDSAIAQTRCSNGDNDDMNCEVVVVGVVIVAAPIPLTPVLIFNFGGIIYE